MSGSTMKDAALWYVRHGLAVIPLGYRSKVPATKNGLKDWTDNPETVEAWWTEHPSSNIGIVCGEPSGGLVAIDIDDHPERGIDGLGTLHDWEEAHGELPDTVSVITGGGGMHLLYRVPDGVHVSPCANEALGVDIRGDGSYIVAPPSVHPDTGSEYAFEDSPEDTDVSEADDAVHAFIEYVRPSSTNAGTARRFKLPKTQGEGGRNDMLFKMARSMIARSDDDDVIIAALLGANATVCKPPLPQEDVEKIFRSAMSKPKGMSGDADTVAPGKHPAAAERQSRRFPHSEIAQRLIDEHCACFIDGTPAIWNGRTYSMGWDAITSAILDMRDDSTISNQREVRNYIALKAPHVRKARPTLIAFTNGVLDVETMELMEFDKSMRVVNMIPHRWNPDAKSRDVDSVMSKIACDDPALELNLSETMGMTLYSSNRFGVFPVLLGRKGDNASNGKSTYIDMMRAMLGDENVSSLDIAVIGQRFQSGMIVGKLANLGDDISNEFVNGDVLSTVKKIATGNKVYTDVKGGSGFEFVPYCTMVFSANEMPKMGDHSDGMKRRMFPMRFNAKFSANDPDFNPDILDKLTTEESCERMCVLAVAGLKRVMANHTFTPNAESARTLDEIELDNDTVAQWIFDGDLDDGYAIGLMPSTVYSDYRKWCDENGVKPVGSRKFSNEITARWHIISVPSGHEVAHGKRVSVRLYEPA